MDDNTYKEATLKSYILQHVVIGVDETGVGSIAGPCCVAAAAFLATADPVSTVYQGVRKDVVLVAGDSKKIKKPEHLEVLAAKIRTEALAVAVIQRSVDEIDNFLIGNIVPESIRLAIARVMERLHSQFPSPSDYLVLLDGDLEIPPGIPCQVLPIAGADAEHWQVGAASILAKQSTDEAMRYLATLHPNYDFANNKGYPTPDHKRRLKEFGASAAHRKTYKPVQAVRPIPKGVEQP